MSLGDLTSLLLGPGLNLNLHPNERRMSPITIDQSETPAYGT